MTEEELVLMEKGVMFHCSLESCSYGVDVPANTFRKLIAEVREQRATIETLRAQVEWLQAANRRRMGIDPPGEFDNIRVAAILDIADPEPPHDNRAEHADRIEALREPLDCYDYSRGIPGGGDVL